METQIRDREDDCVGLSGWGCVVSLIFSVGCLVLAFLTFIDVRNLQFDHPSLIDELPLRKVGILCFTAFFMGFCALANAVIFYVNLKAVFNSIYNSIFKKQTYKFRK